MYDTRPHSQQPYPPKRVRRSRRRRRQQAIRAAIILVFHQLLLVLVAGCLGYLIGTHAGRQDETAQPEVPTTIQTQNQAQNQTQIQTPETSEPSEPAEPSEPSEPTVPADTTAPQLLGVHKLSIFLGSAVAYRSGILVSDDVDPAPKLSVDNSQVDLSTPGTYPVIYTVTDSAGNTTSAETTITVNEAPTNYVDENVIRNTADLILAKIIKEGMTTEDKVNAVYDYMANYCGYIGEFDKSDYMQAAYLMMTKNQGDCFGFYALSRLMFERLGIPNLSVTRMKNELRTTSHYWNMVSLDDGETWYHFDATPHFTYPTRTCLITDADLEAFSELMPGYYFFDHTAYPATPAA